MADFPNELRLPLRAGLHQDGVSLVVVDDGLAGAREREEQRSGDVVLEQVAICCAGKHASQSARAPGRRAQLPAHRPGLLTMTGVALGSSSWAVRQSGSSLKQKRQVRSAAGNGHNWWDDAQWQGGQQARWTSSAAPIADLPSRSHSPSCFPACCSCQRLRQERCTWRGQPHGCSSGWPPSLPPKQIQHEGPSSLVEELLGLQLPLLALPNSQEDMASRPERRGLVWGGGWAAERGHGRDGLGWKCCL